jgi:hypothetical protein
VFDADGTPAAAGRVQAAVLLVTKSISDDL